MNKLREHARNHPEDCRNVADKIGGKTRKRMLEILEEEHQHEESIGEFDEWILHDIQSGQPVDIVSNSPTRNEKTTFFGGSTGVAPGRTYFSQRNHW